MGVDPITIGLTLAAVTAATSAAQAQAQNQAVKSSQKSAARAAGVRTTQQRAQAVQARRNRLRESAQIIGRARVASAEAGVGFEGSSFESLATEAGVITQRDIDTIDTNLDANEALIRSGRDATISDLQGRKSALSIAIASGALSGLSTGLQIGGLFDELGRRKPPLGDTSGGADS